MAVGIQMEATGPLFERGVPIMKSVTGQFIQFMVELGEQRLDITLRPRNETSKGVYLSAGEARRGSTWSHASTGHYRRNVSGSVSTRSLKGTITDGGVIYGPWLEGTSSRNRTSRFPGYASFRRTSQWLQERVGKEAKGFVHRYTSRLNGV
jgi:hypothetical protein